uniref:Uncharacterized protein n=1 Tax=Rhizophora mucronata TaxID=61149 RepID=A0A2P2QL19_RHIMU
MDILLHVPLSSPTDGALLPDITPTIHAKRSFHMGYVGFKNFPSQGAWHSLAKL